MSRRVHLAAALLAFAALVFGLGARPARAAIRPAFGGAATVGAAGPVASTDAALARSGAERLLAAATQCTVTDLLAEPPKVQGGGRVRLRLADNLVFHDGTPITSADVVRSLLRLTDPTLGAPAAWRLLAIQGVADRLAGREATPSIRADGPGAVEVTLAVPGVDLARLLDDPRLPIVKPDGTGCGPFVRVKGPPGARGIVLAPFARHPDGRPFLDRLVVVPTSAADGTRQIDMGALDAAVGRIARKRGRPTGPLRTVTLLLVGGDRDAKTADALRRTLDASIDRGALVRFLVGGGARPLAGLLPGTAAATLTATPPPPPAGSAHMDLAYDPAPDPMRFVAGRVQVRLHDLGLDVTLSPTPGLDVGAARSHDLSLVTLRNLPADPGLAVTAIVFALAGPAPAVATLRKVIAAGDDPAAMATAETGALESLPVVPLYAEPDHLFVTPKLLGAQADGDLALDPAALWRWPLPGTPADNGTSPTQ